MKRWLVLCLLFMVVPALAADDIIVVLNVKSLIYHHVSCPHAQRCTKSCVKIELNEAIKREARPCKACRDLIFGKQNIINL